MSWQCTTTSSTFIKHQGKWAPNRRAHRDALTFINVLTHPRVHPCSHDLHCSFSSCRQTAAVAINVSQHSVSVSLSLSLSDFFFFKGTPPEGKCGRGLVDGWVFRHRQYFPHLSCLNASLLARLNHMCGVLSWINNGHFGGLAGTWWPHADGSLMSSTGTALPWHRGVS